MDKYNNYNIIYTIIKEQNAKLQSNISVISMNMHRLSLDYLYKDFQLAHKKGLT